MAETLTAAAQTRFVHPKQAEFDKRLAKQPVPPPDWRPRIAPLTYPPYQPLVRVYVVAGRSKHDKAGGLSARLRVPLTEVPDPPSAPVITYNESKLILEWTPPKTVHLRIEEPATPAPALPAAPDSGAAGTAPPVPVPPPATGAPAPPPAGASAASQSPTASAPVPPSGTPAGPAPPPSTPPPSTTTAASPPVAGASPATTPTAGQTPAGASTVPTVPVAPLATLNSRPTFSGVIPHTYNVYVYVAAPAGQVLTVPAPVICGAARQTFVRRSAARLRHRALLRGAYRRGPGPRDCREPAVSADLRDAARHLRTRRTPEPGGGWVAGAPST